MGSLTDSTHRNLFHSTSAANRLTPTQSSPHFFLCPAFLQSAPLSAKHGAVMKSSSTACHAGQVSTHSSCPRPPTGDRMYSISQDGDAVEGEGGGGGGVLAGTANWHGELPSLAVLVSPRHLLHCPPAPIPGPGRQSCHQWKIRHLIRLRARVCACVRVCVLIQAYLPTQLPSPLPSVFCCF